MDTLKGPDFLSSIPGYDRFDRIRFNVQRRYQKLLDDVLPFTLYRWIFTAFLLVLYVYRVWMEGWWIISFTLALYLLTIAVGFVSPMDVDQDGSELPLNNYTDGEFKPFVRQIPEFTFWYVI